MVALVSAGQIRSRMSLPDDEGVNAAIGAAIKSLNPIMETLLHTSFTKGAGVDTFYMDSALHVAPNGFFLLRLSNGFLRNTPVTVTYSATYPPVDSEIPSAEFIVKAEKGHILVPLTYDKTYVSVSYEYGFLDSEKVPVWLQEVGIIQVIEMMSAQRVGDEKAEINSVFKYLGTQKVRILDDHLRFRSNALSPI